MPNFLKSSDNHNIAYEHLPGSLPTIIFFPGFFSNMEGAKARFFEDKCRNRGQAYIRFDYRGHGASDGRFEDGTITDWLNDALLVIDKVAEAPVLAVGSSMGGWLALLAALKRPGKIGGLVGIASSPDFTKSIYEERMSDEQRALMDQQGFILSPSEYREKPVKITRRLLDDGNRHLLLNRQSLDIGIPVCLVHGKKDADVPWQKSQKLYDLIGKDQCELIFIPDGEHRLSRLQDLELLDKCIQKVRSEILAE
ncbi:MAG: alpha/beta hydrolase [Balneolaceae bacterium]|nr:alpha/beta hydrolase [Balneolaceae bacterium]